MRTPLIEPIARRMAEAVPSPRLADDAGRRGKLRAARRKPGTMPPRSEPRARSSVSFRHRNAYWLHAQPQHRNEGTHGNRAL